MEKKQKKGAASAARLKFVVHKHDATRLHYDLRLEHDGVLKSWAVPKEPPLVTGVKRLAVRVADHELGYETFEGAIPKGSYGAGTVEIWDRGRYVPVKWDTEHIEADMRGDRLKGIYHLIRFRSKDEAKQKNWLLFKK